MKKYRVPASLALICCLTFTPCTHTIVPTPQQPTVVTSDAADVDTPPEEAAHRCCGLVQAACCFSPPILAVVINQAIKAYFEHTHKD